MVWQDLTQTLLTIYTLSLCTWSTSGQIPLYTSDVPEQDRGSTIKKLELTLLNILGMKDVPTKSKKDKHIPQYMLDLYEQQLQDPDYMSMNFNKDNAYHANTVRSFAHVGTKSHPTNRNVVNLYFNVSRNVPSHEDIILAELHLHPHTDNSTHRYKIEVYELISSPQSVEKSITRLISTKVIQPNNESSWQQIDITPAAQRWHSSNRKITGVQVQVKRVNGEHTHTNHLRLRRDTSASDSEWQVKSPQVMIFSHDKTLSRTKRGSGRRRNRGAIKRIKSDCQRREMTVDFKEVGWEDWILAPRKYDAYYCHGACPFPLNDHLNATNHAIIQTLVNNVDPEAVPQACCVPTDLSPISMLYLNGEHVALKNYPDMVVQACGCR